jgi:hypothetical protein
MPDFTVAQHVDDFMKSSSKSSALSGLGAITESEAAAQIETALEDYLPLDGSSPMAGSLDLGNNTINNAQEINLADVLRFPFGSVHDGYLSDGSSTSSVDWLGRTLRDGAGALALDWHQHLAFDSFSQNSVDWESRFLFDGNSNMTIDWSNRQLFASDGSSVVAEWYSNFAASYPEFHDAILTNPQIAPLSIGSLASAEGTFAYVTDADTPVVGSAVVSGGSDKCLTFNNGTDHIVIALL